LKQFRKLLIKLTITLFSRI